MLMCYFSVLTVIPVILGWIRYAERVLTNLVTSHICTAKSPQQIMGSLVKGYFARQQVSNSALFLPLYSSKKMGYYVLIRKCRSWCILSIFLNFVLHVKNKCCSTAIQVSVHGKNNVQRTLYCELVAVLVLPVQHRFRY